MSNKTAALREQISQRVAALRLGRNLSSRELSGDLEKCESYINKIENGMAMPSMDGFLDICDYFGITPAEFFAENANNPAEYKRLTEIYSTLTPDNAKLLLTIAEKLAASQKPVKRK